MQPDDVEIIREAFARWNQRDIDYWIQHAQPQVEIWSKYAALDQGGEPYRGHSGMLEWRAEIDRNFEFHEVSADDLRKVGDKVLVLGAVYHGHAGLRRWHRDFEDAWEEVRVEPEAYCDLGEQILVLSVWRGRGLHSGVDVALPAAQVGRWRDGLLTYIKGYAHREDAFDELGVSPDVLEPLAP